MSVVPWLLRLPVIQTLGWTLVHSLWQGAIAGLALAILWRAMRSFSAGARYLVAIATLFAILLCAVATFAVLTGQAPPVRLFEGGGAPIFVGDYKPSIARVASPYFIPHSMTWDERLRPVLPWLAIVWMVGVIALGCAQLAGWLTISRMRRSGTPVGDADANIIFRDLLHCFRLARPVQFVQSSMVHVPSVIGWLRPVVLLPMNALTGLTGDQLRGLLAHELAHVCRCDYLVNAVQTVVETLLFYHPAVWWIGRVIRQERENACDDLAAAVCDRETYAQALATMERLRQSPALAMGARGGMLLPRIRRVLGLPPATARRSGWPILFILTVAIATAVTLLITPGNTHAVDAKPATAQSQTEFANAQPPTAEDLKSHPEEYRIGPNDLLTVSIMDLTGPGKETVKTTRVSDTGSIRLPYINEITAAGKTEGELETVIGKTFEDRGVLHSPVVSVTVTEARARTFSILGSVSQPGQYAIGKSDFRLLDALVLSRDISAPVDSLYVIRPEADKADSESRIIQIPIKLLKDGDLKYNVVIRPNDLIIARPSSEPAEVIPWRADALKKQLNEMDRSIEGMSAVLGENNPRIIALKAQREAMRKTIEELRASPGSEPPQGEYYVGGDVPRTGVYSLTNRRITLLQALYAAGADLGSHRDQHVHVRRRTDDDHEESHDFKVADLMDKNDSFYVQPRDVIDLRPPSRPVRLVIAPDRFTFQGNEITPVELEETLNAVADRSDTVLEVAVSTDKVDVGRLGSPMATASKLGFRYISFIGVHPLGSKAGDEAPATQPTK